MDALRDMRAWIDAGQHREAWRAMCRALAIAPTASTCQVVADALPSVDPDQAGLTPQRVAILTNVTLDPVAPIFAGLGAVSGLSIRTYVPAFDAWVQEIVDPASGLRRFQPEAAIVYLRLERLCPPLTDAYLALSAAEAMALVDETAARVESALRTLRGSSSARLMLMSFATPLHPALGILDAPGGEGQTRCVDALNDRLAALATEIGNAVVLDTNRLRARLGESVWHDARMWSLATLPHGAAALQALAHEWLRVLRAMAGRARKALILDADDTLWGGVLGEVGFDGIEIGDRHPGSAHVAFQRAVLEWHRRGVVLGLLSRNEEADVLRVLDEHPAMELRSRHFAGHRIDWQDKAENMVALAEELGLGLDSVVYVDDSVVECDRMRQALPEVHTIQLDAEPAGRAAMLRSLGVFDTLSYGVEDRARGDRYRVEADRRKLQRELPSLEDFHRSLEMVLTIDPLDERTLARAADLTRRTNQFNLRPTRFTPSELRAAAALPGREAFVFRLRDRFGDYGLVGVGLIAREGSRVELSQFLLSCRVLKRTVEDTVLAFLVERGREGGRADVVAWYQRAPRNEQVRDLLVARGFDEGDGRDDGLVEYRLPAGRTPEASPWVTIAQSPADVGGRR